MRRHVWNDEAVLTASELETAKGRSKTYSSGQEVSRMPREFATVVVDAMRVQQVGVPSCLSRRVFVDPGLVSDPGFSGGAMQRRMLVNVAFAIGRALFCRLDDVNLAVSNRVAGVVA